MQDILEKLYNYEYFGIYLMIAIVVLVLLFIVVLFYGKKDKKEREIEATKKLQQVNEEAFKQENNVASVEIMPEPSNINMNVEPSKAPAETQAMANMENDTLVFPTMNTEEEKKDLNGDDTLVMPIENLAEEKKEPNDSIDNSNPNILETNAPFVEPEISTFEPSVESHEIPAEPLKNFEQPINDEETKPILDKIEEQPLVFNDLTNELNDSESNEDLFSKVEVPEFNFESSSEPIKEEKSDEKETKNLEVFSSVFTPQIDNNEIPNVFDEIHENPEERDEADIPSDEEMEIELPSLKKEVLEEMNKEEEKEEDSDLEIPILNDYNINDLSGETYDLNK